MKKILILLANPRNASDLRLSEEVRKIQEALKLAKHRDQFQIATKWAVQVEDLRREMLDYQPNIVHFSGHGAGTEGLAFEDNSGITQLVSGEALATLFELFPGRVECVLLNACYSEVQAQAIHQYVDYVICMKQLIGDIAAIEFVTGFYDALGAGKDYDYAFKMGRNAIQLKGIQEHLIPVIKSRPFSISVKKAPTPEVRYRGFPFSVKVNIRNVHEREPPSLLPYLPNRNHQEFELGKALQLLLKQFPPHPLVCIIHGNEFQSHDKFLERLRNFSLPKLLRLDPTQAVIKEYLLNWPTGLKNLDQLRERLRKNLADSVLGYSFASLEEINETFCKYPNPIIIHTYLLTEDWQQQGFEILNKLLEFWQNWPELMPGQKLIVCVFIKYRVKRQKYTERFSLKQILYYLKNCYKWHRYQSINNKIRGQLEVSSALNFQHFNQLTCTVLSELTNISIMQVENWVRSEETKQFVGEVMIQKLVNEVRDIFYHWEKKTTLDTIPMDNLAEELTCLLKSMLRH